MKVQRLLLVTLTIVNCVLLVFLLAQMRPVEANTDSSVLRVRGLEIVDERGKVRASIRVFPADPDVPMPDGSKGYPETVLMRFFDNGRPAVKLSANARGAGILLGGTEAGTWARLHSDGAESALDLHNAKRSLHLTNKDGQER